MVGDTEEARQCSERYPRPLNVIEGPLMKVSFQMVNLISIKYGKCVLVSDKLQLASLIPNLLPERINKIRSTYCILADRWVTMSESQLISAFLFGAPFLSLKQNRLVFSCPVLYK